MGIVLAAGGYVLSRRHNAFSAEVLSGSGGEWKERAQDVHDRHIPETPYR